MWKYSKEHLIIQRCPSHNKMCVLNSACASLYFHKWACLARHLIRKVPRSSIRQQAQSMIRLIFCVSVLKDEGSASKRGPNTQPPTSCTQKHLVLLSMTFPVTKQLYLAYGVTVFWWLAPWPYKKKWHETLLELGCQRLETWLETWWVEWIFCVHFISSVLFFFCLFFYVWLSVFHCLIMMGRGYFWLRRNEEENRLW